MRGSVLLPWVVFWLLSTVMVTRAEVDSGPTPKRSTAIVINEVYYHPASDDSADQWLELHHVGQDPIDLGGWRLEGDVQFTFPPATRVVPGAFLIVCGDVDRFHGSVAGSRDGSPRCLGNWTGRLGRRKGLIRLVDAGGGDVDLLEYADRGRFPELADGYGRSLERRNPIAPTNEAANWGASTGTRSLPRTWRRVSTRGVATSNRLYFYLTAEGAAYVDDVSLRSPSGGPNLLSGGEFEERGSWQFTGTHARSQITTEAARSGRGCLLVRADGPGRSSGSSVMHQQLRVEPGQEYVLEFWIRFDGPPIGFVARLSGAREGNGIYVESAASGRMSTPGAENSLLAAWLPPFVYPVSHQPRQPGPRDRVRIEAHVAASTRIASVRVHFDAGGGFRSEALQPGRSNPETPTSNGNGESNVAAYSAEIGPFAPGALVRYRVEAVGIDGCVGRYPFEGSPTSHVGFRVEAASEGVELPTYHLFLPDATQRALEANPSSDTYQNATLAYEGRVFCDVGVRRRGHTSRYFPKHHWKIRFNNDHAYRSPTSGYRKVRSINLNSAFADKIYMREPLSYRLWRDLGEAYCGTEFVRLFVNGEFFGLYVQVENPGDDYLARNDLEEGWLWKAYQPGHGEGRSSTRRSRSPGFFQRLFGGGASVNETEVTRRTRYGGIHRFELKAGDPLTGAPRLAEFLRQINELQGAALEKYIREHMNVDSMVNFLAASQVVHSADHVEKNYMIYADPGGRFTLLPWDLDLTHGRNYELRGGIINDSIRWDMWDPEQGDERLLFGTLVHPKNDGPWNAVINAFLGKTKVFRRQYYERIAYCLRHYYHPDILIPRVERLRETIRADIARDQRRWGRYQGGDTNPDRRFALFLDWIRRRYAHLNGKLMALGIQVGKPLSASFEVDRPRGPAPLEVRFRNFSVGAIDRVAWDFGDGTLSNEPRPRHVYRDPGRYDVTLVVTGPDGTHRSVRRECVYVEDARSRAE